MTPPRPPPLEAPAEAPRCLVDVGAWQRPAEGECVCGDGYAIFEQVDQFVVALADGLGHGPRAAEAARAFCAAVSSDPLRPLDELFALADAALVQTRGVAASVVRIDRARATLEFAGVGNVELRAPPTSSIHPVSTPGVVGRRPRRPRPFRYALGREEMLMLASDGIHYAGIEDEPAWHEPVQDLQLLARRFVEVLGKPNDDASCVMIRIRPDVTAGDALEDPGLPDRHDQPQQEETLQVSGRFDSMWASRRVVAMAEAGGFGPTATWELAIAASELVSNVVKYARKGRLTIRTIRSPHIGIELIAEDAGPGMADVVAAMQDGYSQGVPPGPRIDGPTRESLGTGLGSVRRMMDVMEVESKPGNGTRIVARKWLDAGPSGQ